MKIVIVGGGTAGWITALLTRHALRGDDITVIESSELGILGAGEGVTPHFVGHFLDHVGIPVSDLMRHTGATLKHAIKHTDWCGDGSSYHHPFDDAVTPTLDFPLRHPERLAPDHQLNFSAHCCEAGKVLFTPRHAYEADPRANPIANLIHHGSFALHFDAVKLAGFLAYVASQRNIAHVDGRVTHFDQDERGFVRRVHLEGGRSVDCDFVFDCTGFHRLILGKLLGARWRSLKRTLPVDRALPFTLPHGADPLPAYTEAIALRSGWMWKIPVQERFGCGYVYDSEFADPDSARAELAERFGADVDTPRVLSFDAGYYEDIWIGNVFGAGLSTGFLEPLEATSIWVTVSTVREFLRAYLPVGDDRGRAEFRSFYGAFMQRIVDFLYLHYLTPRRDSPFWATFAERTEAPERVRQVLADGGYRWFFEEPHDYSGHPQPFITKSWAQVAAGVRVTNTQVLAKYWRYYNLEPGYDERLAAHVELLRRQASGCLTHREFIARMRG
jgi:tryptophan halogenase